ncbi:hypothetical protein F5B22DRAFT_369286 [Xylaria bambusicola]|uniref:uncharacterized protein n=1 Tax=Xylaria bambusicola TaxID=326684 RepID=UPI002007CA70|nr:uncharacterized protein F5B22DRAFT_369286 [Xylaria bambusicola]KAI0509036.1 hypothetical protein F5B22DRAFT_369286 [Xylaria bambusicola]
MFNSKQILSVATLAGASSALYATSTPGQDPTCVQSILSFSDAPSPAPALLSYLDNVFGSGPVTAPGATTALPDFTLEDPAGYEAYFRKLATELPASLTADFQTYAAGLISYGRDHLSAYEAYITDCITTGEAASTLIDELHDMLLVTATPTPTAGASNGTYPTGTGSYTAQPTATGSPIPTAAAARPTGAIVGGAALGGLLAVAAML